MQSFLQTHAIYAIVLFGVLEAMCIPISSELTFLLGGAIASGEVTSQHPSLALVIILGTIAEMVGSSIAYGVGRAGGTPLVRRWGKYVLVTEADVARAERFLVGRGVWAVPVARMLPFVRAFASIVAGVVDVPPLRFSVLNLIGTFVYVVVLSSIGYSLGSEWAKINHDLTNATYVLVVVVVLAIIGFVLYRLREYRRETAVHGTSAHGAPASGAQGTAAPGTGAPGTGAPGTGAPGTAAPRTGAPGAGKPGPGKHAAKHSKSGETLGR